MINADRHKLACSIIFKAISKTNSLGSCFVCMDIGSNCEDARPQNQLSAAQEQHKGR
jgi:hypothetical protein